MNELLKPEYLTALGGIVLSLVFTYFPWVNVWYAKLDSKVKPLIMLILLLLVSGSIFGLSCWKVTSGEVPVVCSEQGAVGLVKVFFLALISNQSTYLITPTPKSVDKAKALRSKG